MFRVYCNIKKEEEKNKRKSLIRNSVPYWPDDSLVPVILLSVNSPTGGMVMCLSSSQVSILHLQKDVLIL